MSVKRISDSSITVIQQMMPTDSNLAGNIHGGTIMKLVDNTAGIVASRHSSKNSVTASIDRIDFHSPVYVGDLLKIHASINYVGKKSMEIGARVEAEDPLTGEVRHTASAYLTFVSLDKAGKALPIPEIALESETEERRQREALARRAARLRVKNCEIKGICEL
ncbi:MAG: acyl-CoA thioesterase [Deltaproteobacteria bacterium]|nr:acyl-CoA thioesterase [Deltaproteobacteria bacterium]